MENHLLSMITAASNNFRRDMGILCAIFDGYTQPGAPKQPASLFHLKAVFEKQELLGAYRAAMHQATAYPPSLMPTDREELTKKGISTHGIPDRGAIASAPLPAQGLSAANLSANAERLRTATQGLSNSLEVQLVMQILGDAVVNGTIAPLVMDQRFREGVNQLVQHARQSHPSANVPLSPAAYALSTAKNHH